MTGPERTLVIKFGGTSVGDGAAFRRAARITAEAALERPVAVVVSAMSGTTDSLLGVADATARREVAAAHEDLIEGLRRTLVERHLRAAREVVLPERLPSTEGRVLSLIENLVGELWRYDGDPKARRASIAVHGERLSAEILAGAISAARDGAPAAVVAEDPIATDGAFREAEVDPEATRERCERFVAPLLGENTVAVVPGFVGRSPEGLPTTLGRGGSDLSATVVGRALGAPEVWIMSDVDGVLDADPRLVPGAALLPSLSYGEETIFASLGAKVLHYRTMEPAAESGTEVSVRNTFAPERPGTRITDQESGRGLRCVALRRGVAIDIPCGDGCERRVASVVCIGTPEKGDLKAGKKCLRKAKIPFLHAGVAAAGLVFYVAADAAEEALRALHEGLITPSRASREREAVA